MQTTMGTLKTALALGALTTGVVLAGPAAAGAAPVAGPARSCVVDLDTKSSACFSSPAGAEQWKSERGAAWQPRVTFFDGPFYASASIQVGGSKNCTTGTGDIDYDNDAMPAGWNNRASSFATYNGCDLKAFDGGSQTGGGFANFNDHDSELTTWNNRISSFWLS